MDHHTERLQRLFDGLQKPLPVRIIAINPVRFAHSHRDMLHGVGIFHSNSSRHNTGRDDVKGSTRAVSTVAPYPCPYRHSEYVADAALTSAAQSDCLTTHPC